MKSPVALEPETFDVRASCLGHTVSLGVLFQLLQVGGPRGVLYPEGGLDGGQPVVHGSWARGRGC